ncbi:hypothetical protein TRFO_12804 [Tritrichomonas foetus]|uniref:Uncharacterized protein n=1 Tax=Tritrichomonas foetus TaxID=1144522 RepID=A0A1J4L4R8_9EUKA|nr:hypothetical protein TRFO_12804 [Tritrichomonas foetus]|eukprot:OHT16926.1 hypothetical protein TRFO_12804 [Tritrichomonas foetus]
MSIANTKKTMIELITCGVVIAIALSAKICLALQNNVTVSNISYIKPGNSFEKLVTAASVSEMSVSILEASTLLDIYESHVEKWLPSSMQDYKIDIQNTIQEINDFASYNYSAATKSCQTIVYNNETKELSYLFVVFECVNQTTIIGDHMFVHAQFNMPSSFVVVEISKKNKISTTTEHQMQKLPKNFNEQVVIDAISMAISPILQGYILAPKYFMEYLNIIAHGKSINGIPSSFK